MAAAVFDEYGLLKIPVFNEYGFLEVPVTSDFLKQENDPYNQSKAASVASNLFSAVSRVNDVRVASNLNKVENFYIGLYSADDICECMDKYFDPDDYKLLPCTCTLKFIETDLVKSPTLPYVDALEVKEQSCYPQKQEEKSRVVIQSGSSNNDGDFDDQEEEGEFWYCASFQRFKRANGRSRASTSKLQAKKETKVRKGKEKNR